MPQSVEILSEVTFYATEILKDSSSILKKPRFNDYTHIWRFVFVSTRMSKYLSVKTFEIATSSKNTKTRRATKLAAIFDKLFVSLLKP